MKERFNVKLHTAGFGFEMHMANGVIDVPDEKGCYVLSTGCGTGKTECCKSIIRQCHDYGILYCVDTIEELDKMYCWIRDNNVDLGIKQEDVIIVSSDRRHQEFLNQYQDNPAVLMQKKIVMITHVRFWTDLINYFLIYRPQTNVEPFDGDFRKIMQRPDLRRYVLFDETPRFIRPFFSMEKGILSSFANYKDNGWCCCSVDEIRKKYNKFLHNSEYDPFSKSNSSLNSIKREVIFNLIPQYFPQWIDSRDPTCDITFTPLNLSQPIVNTHILVLEGVGNVLFQNSNYYKLLDIKEKYNSPIHFEKFDFNVRRRSVGIDVGEFDKFIEWCAQKIAANQAIGKKTLVAVWKNHGKGNNDSNDFGYYQSVVNAMEKYSQLNRDMYRVIYYGSPESKSTNEFRDFDEIILGGTWYIPNCETEKFKRQYGVMIESKRHLLWAFVQLICRIGIRLHNGRKYTVCYSSDFNDDFITELKNYLGNNELRPFIDESQSDIPDWLMDKFNSARIRVNFHEEIMKLCNWNEWILESIRSGERHTYSIDLNEIRDLIPRSRAKRSQYDKLRAALKKLGITLKIN